MPRGRATYDSTTLAMALVGYQIERQKVEEKIREIRAQLAGVKAGAETAAKAGAPRRRRTLSAAARKRIGEAQRKRWAEHHKKMAQAGKG
jgi:hypothetical protein